MADGVKAISKQLQSEGPYDPPGRPGDPGGETVWGIDYLDNHDPNDPITTELWQRLAWLKANGSFPISVSTDAKIISLATQFYARLWKTMSLDLVTDQMFANEIFGAYNNQGPKVILWLQRVLNALNFNVWKIDLPQDGILGPATADRINHFMGQDALDMKQAFASYRIVDFIESDSAFPARRENTRGLINRANQGG